MSKLDRRAAHVFDWLGQVEARPAMYLGDRGLAALELLLHGYDAALEVHDLVEDVPALGHFASWLGWRTKWSMSQGWARAISAEVEGDGEQLRYFFARIGEFRVLSPKVVASVNLDDRHQPTGRQVVIGADGRLPRPDRVDVVRYVDSPLHFLAFHHGAHVESQGLLRVQRGESHRDVETTLQDAVDWLASEFRLEASQLKRHE